MLLKLANLLTEIILIDLNFLLQLKISTMEDMFQDGVQAFVRYQKDTQGKKSGRQKKKQRVQKMIASMKDPIARKERHRQRRKQDKMKLHRQLDGKTQQQCRVYLDGLKQAKLLTKQKCIKGLQTGTPILIDAVFEHRMNEKQNKSLAGQIQLIMKAVKHMQDPVGIHLCNVNGFFKQQLQVMRYQHWILKSYEEDVIEVAKKLNKRPIYLSPDATDQLTQIESDAAYIIGGLVDRTVIKNASLDRAQQLKIPAVKLPISQFMKGRKCLNLDHVVSMISKFKQTGNWKTAFDFAAPKRWKKDAVRGNKKQENQQIQQKQASSEDQSNSLNEDRQQVIKQKTQEKQEKIEAKNQTQTQ